VLQHQPAATSVDITRSCRTPASSNIAGYYQKLLNTSQQQHRRTLPEAVEHQPAATSVDITRSCRTPASSNIGGHYQKL